MNAWVFVLDGHMFYVLNVDGKTLVCDLASGQWHHWYTGPVAGLWALLRGRAWQGTAIAADGETSRIAEIDPHSFADIGGEQIRRVVTGIVPHRGRSSVRVGSARVTASMGEPTLLNAAVTLRFSDDEGDSWSEPYAIALSPDDFAQVLRYRSLGRVRAPGRIFEVSDTGGVVTIEGMDADVDAEE